MCDKKVLVTKINKQSFEDSTSVETKVSDKMTRPKVVFFIKDQEGSAFFEIVEKFRLLSKNTLLDKNKSKIFSKI